MKQILFVDDEPFVLEGLQRMLRPLRHEWDMSFVESGPRALEVMAQRPFDVIVSDMRMPGMNGAELLTEVMRRHPRTIRLVLSGHADRELIMKCVGCAHQFLAKPCEPAALQATLQRATALEASTEGEAARRLAPRLEHLPSLPGLYGELVALLQRPEIALEDVAHMVEQDPAISAKILKLVNSAFFGLQRPVANLLEACTHLGLDTMRSLVLSLQTFSQFESLHLGGIEMEPLWRHSLRVAHAAKHIAQLQAAAAKIVDESFVAGLLHDVGKLILAANCPEDYVRALQLAREHPQDLIDAEKAVFGCNHADVGGYLLGLWGLPVPVVEAIALHHRPSQCPSREFGALTAVHVANVLVQERDGLSDVILCRGLDGPYLKALGLEEQANPWRQEITRMF